MFARIVTTEKAIKVGLYLLKACGVGWVYILSDLKLSAKPVSKVGFKTDTMGERVGDIIASVNRVAGKETGVGPVWAVPSLAPREVERIVHWIFRFLSTNPYPGSSGCTEWFKGYNVGAAFAIIALGVIMGADPGMIIATAGIAVFFPFPMDLASCVTLFSGIQLYLVYKLVCLLTIVARIVGPALISVF